MNVRLKSTLNRRVGDKEYRKWLIADVPPAIIDELGWGEGEELEAVIDGGELRVRRVGQHP